MSRPNSFLEVEPRPKREIVIPATDGLLLRGTVHRPKDNPGEVCGVITIHPAVGAAETSYAKVAEHLANRGYAVITYSYRGTGRSGLKRDTHNEHLRMTDWITKDVPGVLEWAREQVPGRPAYAIGHGVGGHGMLWAGSEGTCDAGVLVGVGSGYIANVPGFLNRVRTFGLFTMLSPVSAAVLGRIPRQPFGYEEEPPVGVVKQWALWARHRQYFFSDPEFDFPARYARANGRFLSVRVAGDRWCTERGADAVTDRLYGAEVEKRRIGAHGERIGHMGLFTGSFEPALWDEMLDWLDRTREVDGADAPAE